MARRGDRQEFGQPLDDTEQDDGQKMAVHGASNGLWQEGRAVGNMGA